MATSTVVFPARGSFCEAYPTKVNTSVAFLSGTSSEYFPSALVMVPMVVPSTSILTPGNGVPFSSVTVPVTFYCCSSTLMSVSLLSKEDILMAVFLPSAGITEAYVNAPVKLKNMTIRKRTDIFIIVVFFDLILGIIVVQTVRIFSFHLK